MKFSKEVKLFIINIIVLIICSISILYIFLNTNHEGYTLLFTQPIVFYFSFLLVLSKKLLNLNNSLFLVVFTGVSFIRYVVLPLFIVHSSFYGGRSPVPPANDSYLFAIILMNIELIIVVLLIAILSNRGPKNQINSNNFSLNFKKSNYDGYYLFISITLLIALLFPKIFTQINFIIPTSLNTETELTTLENIIFYCVIVSKHLLYIIIVKKIQYRYRKKQNEKWIFFSVIISLINISIYFGTNRMDIIISAMVSIYLLIKVYGKKVYKYSIILISIVLLLFGTVTVSRNYASVSNSQSQLIDLTDTLQVYTGGVYNVALAIETIKFYPQVRSLKVLFMDIFRPMIGPNVLVRNIDIPYSSIYFNRRIRPNSDVVSQILPMVGQGYIYFGALFSWILSLLFVRIQYFLEKILNQTSSLEVFYFVSLSSARLGMLMGSNTMNLINDLSMNLVLFSMVYIFNKYFKFSTKRKSRKLNGKII